MIKVWVKMYPHGDKCKKFTMGVLRIWNDSTGDEKVGNYKWELDHSGAFYNKRKNPWKRGTVKGFRRTLCVWTLVARALKAAGQG